MNLDAVAGNLLCQLGALSAEQTRKATILQGHWPLQLCSAVSMHTHANAGSRSMCKQSQQWYLTRLQQRA